MEANSIVADPNLLGDLVQAPCCRGEVVFDITVAAYAAIQLKQVRSEVLRSLQLVLAETVIQEVLVAGHRYERLLRGLDDQLK